MPTPPESQNSSNARTPLGRNPTSLRSGVQNSGITPKYTHLYPPKMNREMDPYYTEVEDFFKLFPTTEFPNWEEDHPQALLRVKGIPDTTEEPKLYEPVVSLCVFLALSPVFFPVLVRGHQLPASRTTERIHHQGHCIQSRGRQRRS